MVGYSFHLPDYENNYKQVDYIKTCPIYLNSSLTGYGKKSPLKYTPITFANGQFYGPKRSVSYGSLIWSNLVHIRRNDGLICKVSSFYTFDDYLIIFEENLPISRCVNFDRPQYRPKTWRILMGLSYKIYTCIRNKNYTTLLETTWNIQKSYPLVQILQLGGIAATNMEGQASSRAGLYLVFTIDQITLLRHLLLQRLNPEKRTCLPTP